MAAPVPPAVATLKEPGCELRLVSGYVIDLTIQTAQAVFICPPGERVWIEQIDLHSLSATLTAAAQGNVTLSAGWSTSATEILNPTSPNILLAANTGSSLPAGLYCANLFPTYTPPAAGLAGGYMIGLPGQKFYVKLTYSVAAPAAGATAKIGVMGHISAA